MCYTNNASISMIRPCRMLREDFIVPIKLFVYDIFFSLIGIVAWHNTFFTSNRKPFPWDIYSLCSTKYDVSTNIASAGLHPPLNLMPNVYDRNHDSNLISYVLLNISSYGLYIIASTRCFCICHCIDELSNENYKLLLLSQ